MNSTLYFIAGIASLVFGAFITIKQIKTFKRNEQDRLGFDIKLLFGGIIFIMLGIALIAKVF